MSTLERQLTASLARDDHDFIAAVRLKSNARPLTQEGAVELHGADAERLIRLAEEALRLRTAAGRTPQIGAKGRLIGVDEEPLIARVLFIDLTNLRRAGELITRAVSIEPALDTPIAANAEPGFAGVTWDWGQGEGSPNTAKETP